MYELKAKVNFYDKENPGRMMHPGELLTTKDKDRVARLLELGFVEVVKAPAEAEPKADENKGGSNVKEVSVKDVNYSLAKVKEALNAIGVKIASNATVDATTKAVSGLTEEQADELVKELTK